MIGKIVSGVSDRDLIRAGKELTLTYFPDDAIVRKLASKVFDKEAVETNVMEIMALAPSIATELAKRFERSLS
jgi:hypothetical protein